MGEDWFLDALDSVEEASAGVAEALAAVTVALEGARKDREAGVPLPEMVDRLLAVGGKECRIAASTAVEIYEHAVLSFRARVIRHLVDDEGCTLSDAARRLGISRQRASRLCSSAANGFSSAQS